MILGFEISAKNNNSLTFRDQFTLPRKVLVYMWIYFHRNILFILNIRYANGRTYLPFPLDVNFMHFLQRMPEESCARFKRVVDNSCKQGERLCGNKRSFSLYRTRCYAMAHLYLLAREFSAPRGQITTGLFIGFRVAAHAKLGYEVT
jgi:hypothetical protein